jgi:Carboxypeptidase regulatory-like domain/TonB dependent receptor
MERMSPQAEKTACAVHCLRARRFPLTLSFIAVISLTALAPTAGFAQVTGTATLVGTVTDSTGSAIPGAKITVVNSDTAFRSETVTGTDGSYTVPYLSPGSYKITMEAAGFKLLVRDNVQIRTGEEPRVDGQMEVGAVTEAVEVTAQSPLLNTDSTVVGQIMENSALVKLETPQGHLVRYLNDYANAEYAGNGGDWHIAGLRARAVAYTLDGMTAKTPGINTFQDTDNILLPNAEAIQEVAVSTSGMSAEYGHAAGGQMAAVFKSGTNEFHGSVDERYIWKALVDRDYLTQVPLTNIPLYYDWFNGAFSGPVRIPKLYNGKNKTFFLFSYGAFLQSGGQPVAFVNVPTAAMMNGNFNFGPGSLTIYNPYTIRQSGSTYVSDPFPNNQIPASLISPVVTNFLSHNPFAAPNSTAIITQTGPQQNYTDSPGKIVHRYISDQKVDHQFSPNHKFFVRTSFEWEPAWYKGGAAFTQQIAWQLIDPSRQLSPEHNYNDVISDTYIFSPTKFNELRLGFNRRTFNQTSGTAGQNWSQELGIPNVSALGFPVFSIPTYGYFGSLGTAYQAGNDLSVQDNFTWIAGKHTFKMGYELMRTSYNSVLQAQPSGTYTFTGTEEPFTPNTGNPFADFLLGTVSSAVYTQNYATWLPRWWHHAVFVQDDWKPVRGLTLNLGLRWSHESPFETKYGQQSEFNPNVVDPLTGLMGAITHPTGPLAKSQWDNFQPRLGLAWNFKPKWVFRSSFGIMTQDLTVNGINQNFNEYQGTANIQQLPGNPNPAFTLSQGPPAFSFPVQSNGSVAYVGTNYSARNADWIDPHIRMPYVAMWSADLQYELKHNLVAELDYQGNAGVGLLENWNINQIPFNISTNPTVLNQIYAAQQNYKPYPQFGTINLYSNFGHSTYHAGTIRLERRYTSGMTLIVLDTYAKAIDECDNDGTCNGEDYYNRRLEKAQASYNVKDHFQTLFTYQLPFGKGRHFWTNGILSSVFGGLETTMTWILETGTPGTITFSGGPNKYLTQNTYRPTALSPDYKTANWTIGPNRFPTSAQNPYLIFNDIAYPASFTLGTLGRNTYTGPGENWLQLGLSKTFTIRDRVKFMLRAEGNNFPFKQPELLLPNGVYNVNSANLFGTFTSLRVPFSDPGQSRPHLVLGGRIQF